MEDNGIYTDPRHTACFTGHRPEKIPFDTGVKFFREALESVLYLHAMEAAEQGYDTFLCGMQRGIDVWAGNQILRLKEKMPNLRLICVSPFSGERESRQPRDRFDYDRLVDACDGYIVLQKGYDKGCFAKRNRFMVERSSLIIGAVADRRSGTGQTLRYAKSLGLKADEIDLRAFGEQYGFTRADR